MLLTSLYRTKHKKIPLSFWLFKFYKYFHFYNLFQHAIEVYKFVKISTLKFDFDFSDYIFVFSCKNF